ncbi:MAG: DUF1820 family protein [Gammaproteobacteria bacterium]|nr:DUF1820 family protein [Gammaproteobacteria bacterium]
MTNQDLKKTLFKVIFAQGDKVFEVYARGVDAESMYGFIEVEQLVFGERSNIVVDPSEEKLKTEFESVRRTYIPFHQVLRIDEVEKEGVSKIKTSKDGNVTHAAFPAFTPKQPGTKSD